MRANLPRHSLGTMSVSLAALPPLLIALGGEMVYILEQRLQAQAIPPERARKGMPVPVG